MIDRTPTELPATISLGIVADSELLCSALCEVIGDDPELRIVGTASDVVAGRLLLDAPDLRILIVSLALGRDGTRASGIDFIAKAKGLRPDVGILSLKRGGEEALLRTAIEAGASACCLAGTPQARLLRAIKAVSVGGMWLDPEISEVIFRTRHPRLEAVPRLTARELMVLQLITEGLSNGEMAETLGCATGTIQTHVVNIFEKLGVHDRVSAAVYALRKGLISENLF